MSCRDTSGRKPRTVKTPYEELVDIVIKAEIDGRPRHELILDVGPTPACLLSIGFAPLRVAVKAKTIGKIFFDHGLTRRQIARIPAMLAEPLAIYTSETQPATVVVLTYELNAGYPIIIPVGQGRPVGRGPSVNLIMSMYGKEGPDPRPRWQAAGLLLWQSGTPKRKGPG